MDKKAMQYLTHIMSMVGEEEWQKVTERLEAEIANIINAERKEEQQTENKSQEPI